MVNPTIGQYLALEKRVLRLEKFITSNNDGWPDNMAGKEQMLNEDTLTDYITCYVSQKFYVNFTATLDQN
jgi:hypothetical protein